MTDIIFDAIPQKKGRSVKTALPYKLYLDIMRHLPLKQ